MRWISLALMLTLSQWLGALTTDHVAVAYNPASWASEQVARAYLSLRGIPATHLIALDGLSHPQRIPVAEFRTRIIDRCENVLRERGLADRVRCIAYAPDVPTNIAFAPEAGVELHRYAGREAALTGLTVIAPLLAVGPQAYTSLRTNPYFGATSMPGTEADRALGSDARVAELGKALQDKDRVTAEALLDALRSDHPTSPSVLYNLACLRALRGETAQALTLLDEAVSAGWWDDRHTRADDDLVSVRKDPAFAGLLDRMRATQLAFAPPDSPPFPGHRPEAPGASRMRLAMMLAVTSGRGEAIDLAIERLRRTAAADGSRPAGTVWFMVSGDKDRTGPRRWAFSAAARVLNDLGVAAEISDGTLPPADATVIGAAIGAATFAWDDSGATIVPGAWTDHLTSNGGRVYDRGGQTPLTHLLRHGAAGASGTVIEPFAIQAKFPDAWLHVHRVRGLSLVEAVWRSVAAPYQLLVVGDPLSRPWGQPANVGAVPGHDLVRRTGQASSPLDADGALVRTTGATEGTPLASMTTKPWTTDAGLDDAGGEVEGWIQASEAGLHQIQWLGERLEAWALGDHDWTPVNAPYGWIPLDLDTGWHRLRVRVRAGTNNLELRFGRHGTAPLTPETWRR